MSTDYTCPMHPEVSQDKPGRCPKCGMALVPRHELQAKKATATPAATSWASNNWRNYLPLVVVISLITICAGIVSWRSDDIFTTFLLSFMTGFFLVFGAFKLMDLKGFAEGYSTYDLIAQRWFGYGYVYPFIELVFGLVMLAGYHPKWLLWTEFAVMTISGVGVALKITKREKFMCACLGTFLKVPLTKVTLVEDFGMAAIALVLIVST